MMARTLTEDPVEILAGRILDGTLPATPEGITLVAWVCDFIATGPHSVALYDTGDDLLLGEHSGDCAVDYLLGTVAGFRNQLTCVCRDCGFNDV